MLGPIDGLVAELIRLSELSIELRGLSLPDVRQVSRRFARGPIELLFHARRVTVDESEIGKGAGASSQFPSSDPSRSATPAFLLRNRFETDKRVGARFACAFASFGFKRTASLASSIAFSNGPVNV